MFKKPNRRDYSDPSDARSLLEKIKEVNEFIKDSVSKNNYEYHKEEQTRLAEYLEKVHFVIIYTTVLRQKLMLTIINGHEYEGKQENIDNMKIVIQKNKELLLKDINTLITLVNSLDTTNIETDLELAKSKLGARA